MKKFILLAGAAAFAFGAPALGKPGHGKGNQDRFHSAKSHSKGNRGVIVSDRYGRLYALNNGRCPPGLARKQNGCMPPGQAKKMYRVGQRYNRNFGNLWSYNQVADYLRDRYNLDPNDRYYYRNGYLYQVNPRTMVVQEVISALLR
jgi:hypothetical protein